METKKCQSCGMKINDHALYGLNKDGSLSNEYCKYCYPNGEFNNPDETFDEMLESCIPFEMEAEKITENEAREVLNQKLKMLKRWS